MDKQFLERLYFTFRNLTTKEILQMLELEKIKRNDDFYYELSNSNEFKLFFSETKGNAKKKYISETIDTLDKFVKFDILSDDIVNIYQSELNAISYLSDDKCSDRCIKFIKSNVKKIDKINDITVKQQHIFCLKNFTTLMAICTVNSQMNKFIKNNFYVMDDNRIQMDMKGNLVNNLFDYSTEQVDMLVKAINSVLPECYNKYPRLQY